MKALKLWGGISAGKKEFMVDGLPADIGIGVVLQLRSSLLATSLPVLTCTGIPPVALCSYSEEFLDKVSVMNRLLLVDCQKSFPTSQSNSVYQIAGFGRGSTWIDDLERLLADWERETNFHCKSILHLDILLNHSCNSPSTPLLEILLNHSYNSPLSRSGGITHRYGRTETNIQTRGSRPHPNNHLWI